MASTPRPHGTTYSRACGRSTGSSAPTAPTPGSRGSGAVRSRWLTARQRSPRSLPSARPRASSPMGPSTSGAPTRTAIASWIPTGSSRGGRCNVRRHASRRCRTPTTACPPAETWCARSSTRVHPPGRSASRTPTTRPGWWLGSRFAPVPSPPPASPTAAPTSSTRAPGETPQGIGSVTVVTDDLTWADIDATAAFAMGPRGLDWLSTRPGRCGVVVWADGSAQVFSVPN